MVRLFGCERSRNAHIERKKSKMTPDVGTLDIPTSAYRPDSEVGVEVSDAIVTGHPDLDDSKRFTT